MSMTVERRKSRRFPLNLSVSKINIRGISGKVVNFSRRGMKVILDAPDFDSKPDIDIELYIDRPDYNQQVLITASVVWVKPSKGKSLVGLKFKKIPIKAKADFLKYGYSWQKNNPDN
ncbi:MAG: PilZ domain-containing protein [Candidatus Omnitrophica bacterium]|nr:PilZ domain-containing protein [Candidatus Omnitrophota bacterium]